MKNENYFYLGQTVYSVEFGKGKVIEIKESSYYPIKVSFENNEVETYMQDGRRIEREYISLFQEPITFPTNKPLINLKKGDRVWVRSYGDHIWDCRYFSHFPDFSREKIVCFCDQKKEGELVEWNY
jgi:hypothetical protein